jgi:hypothetical protein
MSQPSYASNADHVLAVNAKVHDKLKVGGALIIGGERTSYTHTATASTAPETVLYSKSTGALACKANSDTETILVQSSDTSSTGLNPTFGNTVLGTAVTSKTTHKGIDIFKGTAISTAGAETYTIAQLSTGAIIRDCAGGARSDVLPTAALIVAGITGVAVNDVFECRILNISDAAETLTITTGTNVTLHNGGSATIAQNESAILIFSITAVTPTPLVDCWIVANALGS